jgi:HPt (histidine-containing phosphotransfer) domain-containing protein
MEQLRARFRERLAADRRPLGEALRSGDREALRAICHRMAGAGGMLGYSSLSARASDLECAVDEGVDAEGLEAITSQLLQGIDEALRSPGAPLQGGQRSTQFRPATSA